MVSKKVVVVNPTGLHARPASRLVEIVKGCTSKVEIHYKDKIVNPKSVLNLLAAMILKGSEIEIVCEGEHEKEDLKTIVDAIEGGLGEPIG